MMHEETPPTTQETTLRERSEGWPWGQTFILLLCIWFLLMGLDKLLVLAGVDAEEAMNTITAFNSLGWIIVGIVAFVQSERLKRHGKSMRRIRWLRFVNTGLFTLGLLMLLLSLMIPAVYSARAAARRAEIEQAGSGTAPERMQTIHPPNSPYAIDVPGHWEETSVITVGTNGVARADIANDLSVAMWTEPKEDLAVSTLDEYAERIIKLLETDYEQFEVVERTSSTVPGQPTIEVVIRVVFDDTRLMIAMRLVEMPDHFVLIRVWAHPSRFRAHEATLRQILRSVHSK